MKHFFLCFTKIVFMTSCRDSLNISREYFIVNLILTILLIFAILAPLFFYVPSVTTKRYPFSIIALESFYTQETGEQCPSTGLTRSVLLLYEGKIELSQQYNQSGCWFVGLLIFQLIMRFVVFVIIRFKYTAWIDIIQLLLSGLLFKTLLFINFQS